MCVPLYATCMWCVPEVDDPFCPDGHHSGVVVHPHTRLDAIVVPAESANQRARHRVVYLFVCMYVHVLRKYLYVCMYVMNNDIVIK